MNIIHEYRIQVFKGRLTLPSDKPTGHYAIKITEMSEFQVSNLVDYIGVLEDFIEDAAPEAWDMLDLKWKVWKRNN